MICIPNWCVKLPTICIVTEHISGVIASFCHSSILGLNGEQNTAVAIAWWVKWLVKCYVCSTVGCLTDRSPGRIPIWAGSVMSDLLAVQTAEQRIVILNFCKFIIYLLIMFIYQQVRSREDKPNTHFSVYFNTKYSNMS